MCMHTCNLNEDTHWGCNALQRTIDHLRNNHARLRKTLLKLVIIVSKTVFKKYRPMPLFLVLS